jgi:hypothetical protein
LTLLNFFFWSFVKNSAYVVEKLWNWLIWKKDSKQSLIGYQDMLQGVW